MVRDAGPELGGLGCILALLPLSGCMSFSEVASLTQFDHLQNAGNSDTFHGGQIHVAHLEKTWSQGHMNICCYYCDGKNSLDKQEGDLLLYIT